MNDIELIDIFRFLVDVAVTMVISTPLGWIWLAAGAFWFLRLLWNSLGGSSSSSGSSSRHDGAGGDFGGGGGGFGGDGGDGGD
ncbi:hypothetical protein [Streptosporangium sp. NPDC003464]